MNKEQKTSDIHTLLFSSYALVGIGLLMNFSISPSTSTSLSLTIFYKQLLYVGIGTVSLILFSYFNHTKLKDISTVLFFLVLISLFFTTGETSRRWLYVGLPFTIQPSQYASLVLSILISKVVSTKLREDYNKKIYIILLGVVILISGLVIIEPDMGSGIIIMLTCGALLLVSGMKLIDFCIVSIPTIMLGAIAIMNNQSWKKRIVFFLNPYSAPTGEGYQALQSFRAIARGGIIGTGFMRSMFKYGKLPEKTADFIFAITAEEFGIIGCTIIIALFIALIYTGFKIAKNTGSTFSRLLAVGIILNIALSALVNISTNIGLLPVTGITLPFISFGGNSMLANLTGVGILINIAKKSGE